MTRTALSVYMYGLYLIFGVGIPFVAMPYTALGLFGLEVVDDLWVRFVGVLAGTIGAFYVASVLTRSGAMFGWSVVARYYSAAFMTVMALLGKASLVMLGFAVFDALTASITWVAMRADAEEQAEARGAP